ncbi:MAG TPA: hypothetical protein PLP06_11115 [Saprospiraceae bacterium]|nr:hypothetical protein [Saprospiraceae bacterium]
MYSALLSGVRSSALLHFVRVRSYPSRVRLNRDRRNTKMSGLQPFSQILIPLRRKWLYEVNTVCPVEKENYLG